MKVYTFFLALGLSSMSLQAQDSTTSDFGVVDLPDFSVRSSLLHPLVGTFELSVENFLPNNRSIVVSPSASYKERFGYYYYYDSYDQEFISLGTDIAIRSYKGSFVDRPKTKANIYFEYALGVDWSSYSGTMYDWNLGGTFEIEEEVIDFKGTVAIGTHFVFKRFLSIDSNVGLGFRHSSYDMDDSVKRLLYIGSDVLDVGYRGVIPKFTIAIGGVSYK